MSGIIFYSYQRFFFNVCYCFLLILSYRDIYIVKASLFEYPNIVSLNILLSKYIISIHNNISIHYSILL